MYVLRFAEYEDDEMVVVMVAPLFEAKFEALNVARVGTRYRPRQVSIIFKIEKTNQNSNGVIR